MQITRTDNSNTNVTLKISADAAELEPIKNHVLKSHFSDVKLPGFRAGKAPLNLIEKNVNQQVFQSEFMEHAVNELYRRAVDEEKLRPVGQPSIELKKFVPYTDFEFEATQDMVGAIKLPNYKTMKLKKEKPTVTAEQVNEVLKNLQARAAERIEVARPAKDGDEVTLDFAGKDAKSGEPIPNADGHDYPLVLGSKSFIPGFEENVVGIKVGDSKDFTVTFPADYGAAELQNKKVIFTVTAKKIAELAEPKVDDDFAAKVGPFQTVAELKADVKKQLQSEQEWQAEQNFQNELIKKIADKSEVDIPEALIEEQMQRIEEEERRNLAYRGQTWQEHLQAEGLTEQEHRERQRPDAESRVKAGLVLSEISEKENIDVTAEEIEARIQVLRTQYQDPQMQGELNRPEARRDIASRILTEKTIAKLSEYASK